MGADNGHRFRRMGGAILGGDVRAVMAAPCADIRVLPPPAPPGRRPGRGRRIRVPPAAILIVRGGGGERWQRRGSSARLRRSEPRGTETSERLRRLVNPERAVGKAWAPRATGRGGGGAVCGGAAPKERRGAQDGGAHGGLSAPYSAAPLGNGPCCRQPDHGGFGVCGGTRPDMPGSDYGAAGRPGGGGTWRWRGLGGLEGGKTA